MTETIHIGDLSIQVTDEEGYQECPLVRSSARRTRHLGRTNRNTSRSGPRLRHL
jgi:hypothetical protein